MPETMPMCLSLWGTVQGIRSIIGRHKIDRVVKKSIGNREAKELIWTIHGHELSRGDAGGWGVQGGEEIKGRKKLGQLE